MYNLYEIKDYQKDSLIIFVEELRKEFKTTDEVFAYLKENKDFYSYGRYRVVKVG